MLQPQKNNLNFRGIVNNTMPFLLTLLKFLIMFENNYFWGMHLFWWFIWMLVIFWIFAIPYDIPGQRKKKNSPLDILKMRYAAGEIKTDEYLEKKKLIEDLK